MANKNGTKWQNINDTKWQYKSDTLDHFLYPKEAKIAVLKVWGCPILFRNLQLLWQRNSIVFLLRTHKQLALNWFLATG